MTDVALIPVQGDFSADIAVRNGDLVADDGMDTAILISLFCDARAADDDVLPQAGADRRGWWCDAYPEVDGDIWGSRLWLVSREKALPDVLTRAREYALEALQWMVDDGVAASVDVVATFPADAPAPVTRWLKLAVAVTRPQGPGRLHYDYVWRFA